MKTWMFVLLCLGSLLPLKGQSLYRQHLKTIERELKDWSENYGESRLEKEDSGRSYLGIFDKTGERLGTLVVTTGDGRFEKFDFMALFGPGDRVVLIRILKYRSPHGGAIANKRWLSQFYRDPGGIYEFRKNIDAISGATLSVRGLIDEVNRVRESL